MIQQAAAAPALTVPESAIETVSGTSRVYVVKDGKVEERIVTLGEKIGGRIEVATGLKDGERSSPSRAAASPTACPSATSNLTRRDRFTGTRRSFTGSPVHPFTGSRNVGSRSMQWLASISVKRPVFATVIILSLTVIGAFSFTPPWPRPLSQGRLPDGRRHDTAAGRRA